MTVCRADIEAAHERIRGHVRATPVLDVTAGSFGVDRPLTLKLELFQHAGSFKPRGAFNNLLSREVPEAGVVAASGGNHGIAVAYAAGRLGIPAQIFVPVVASPVKVARIRGYGAQVTVAGERYADALGASLARQRDSGALLMHAYDQPEVVAGAGTLAAEVEDEVGVPDRALVSVGGGGLIAGIAAWFEGRARVEALEPERAPTLYRARAAGEPVDVDVSGIAADSLGARRLGAIAWDVSQRHVAAAHLLDDDAIRAAQHALWTTLRLAVEPAAALGLAALTTGAVVPAPSEKVLLVICGANVDPSTLDDKGASR